MMNSSQIYDEQKLTKPTVDSISPKPKQTYQTSDLTLTSFLRCRGFQIENIRQNNGRTLFSFPESPELRLAILDFANDSTVNVRSFCSTMRDLKALTRVLIFFVVAAVGAHTAWAQQKPASQKTEQPPAPQKVENGPQKLERGGVEVEFTIEPIAEDGKAAEVMEAKEAVVRFKIHDKAS